jgi:hypothetical protein
MVNKNKNKIMTNKIEQFLNIIHYCLYKLDYKVHMLSNKINPFLLLGKIPAIKRKFEEQGTTHLEVVNKVWTDRRFGFGIMISGSAVVILVFIMILAIYDILNFFLNYPIDNLIYPFVFNMILAYLICHFAVFKKDKYIKYFKKYEKWNKQEKWKYSLISFLYIIITFSLFIYSFRFLPLD